MMYRRNSAQTPRPDAKVGESFATMAASKVLDFLASMGLYEAAHRENRQRNRAEKRAGRGVTYHSAGLNGARAVARRRRQRESATGFQSAGYTTHIRGTIYTASASIAPVSP